MKHRYITFGEPLHPGSLQRPFFSEKTGQCPVLSVRTAFSGRGATAPRAFFALIALSMSRDGRTLFVPLSFFPWRVKQCATLILNCSKGNCFLRDKPLAPHLTCTSARTAQQAYRSSGRASDGTTSWTGQVSGTEPVVHQASLLLPYACCSSA